ncbi:MAG TPA: response regulator [Coleofasciculaceae cyanobacterium]|jgi:DNA-binding NarL/FixJ family response regulator
MSQPVRILLVEDEPLWQLGIESLLETDPRFELAAVADHFEAAMQAFTEKLPEVVLLDWKLKGTRDGLELGAQLLNSGLPPERIILISGSEASSIPSHPFLFVPKSRIADELLPLLESVTIN